MCHTEFNFPSHLRVTAAQTTTSAYRHANQSLARDIEEGEPPSKRIVPDLVHEHQYTVKSPMKTVRALKATSGKTQAFYVINIYAIV